MADQKPTVIARIVDGATLTQALAVDASGRITELNSTSILTSLQLIDDVVLADDAAFTPGSTKVLMVGAEFDDSGTDSVDEGDAGALRMAANRCLYVNIRDNAGNERGLNVDASGNIAVTDGGATLSIDDGDGTITVDGTVTVTATNLDIRDLANATDSVSIYANTAKDGTGTAYQPLVDTDGHLQVDILSGGSVDSPTNPAWDITNLTTPVNLAAGASGDADSADLPSKYLWQTVISGSVAFKAILATNTNGTIVNKAVFFGGPSNPIIYEPPHRAFVQAPTAGAGTQGWRTVVTNLDTSETADFYISYAYADN